MAGVEPGEVAIFSWQLDDELALLFLQPDMASELFRLCRAQPRLPLPVAALGAPHPAARRQRHLHSPAIEKFARGGADHGHRVSGEVVGVIGYNQIDQDLGKVTIGYWLAERWQGHGIITRACQALIHHAFEGDGDGEGGDQRRPENEEPSRVRAAGNDPGGDHPAGGAAGGQGGGSCALRPAAG